MENSAVFYLALLSSTVGFMCMRFLDMVKRYKDRPLDFSPNDKLSMWTNLDRKYNSSTWSRMTVLSLVMFVASPIINMFYNNFGLGILTFVIAFIAGNILNNIMMRIPIYWQILKVGLPIVTILFVLQLLS